MFNKLIINRQSIPAKAQHVPMGEWGGNSRIFKPYCGLYDRIVKNPMDGICGKW